VVEPGQLAQIQEPQRTQEGEGKTTPDWWLVWFTGGLVILAVVQAVLFGRQLAVMAESQKDTRKAADAAVATVETMRTTAQQQLRAYVGVERSRIEGPRREALDLGIAPQRLLWKVKLKNTGMTPASDVRSEHGIAIRDYPLPADHGFDAPKPMPNPSVEVVGSQGTFFLGADSTVQLSHDQWAAVQSGVQKRLYCFGKIVYRDIFGEQHTTKFCRYAVWENNGEISVLTAELYNESD
jgi:hypothetical protein